GQRNAFLDNGMPNSRRPMSEQTAKAIDEEVKGLVEEGHQRALAILESNRDLLETLAQQLLEAEVIEGESLRDTLKQVNMPESAQLNGHQELASV
ncbi:MAG: cell division protein FtsH, partial [Cyanobacteria bacterium Co-bin8]|nr:cell division protein FtsH [Cyanobacteria bacterium Co-bin8]